MSGANYAHCDAEPCLEPSGTTKVLYIGDEDLPWGVSVRHSACGETQIAAAEARGYAKAVANLRDPKILAAYEGWGERDGRIDDGSFMILDARDFASVADYLEAEATKETTDHA